MKVNRTNVNSIKIDSSMVWIIESHHKVDEGTLSTSWLAHKCNRFWWINFQVKASKNKVFFSSWISEPDIFEFNFTFYILKIKSYFINRLIISYGINWRWTIKDIINFVDWSFSSSLIWRTCNFLCSDHWSHEKNHNDLINCTWANRSISVFNNNRTGPEKCC